MGISKSIILKNNNRGLSKMFPQNDTFVEFMYHPARYLQKYLALFSPRKMRLYAIACSRTGTRQLNGFCNYSLLETIFNDCEHFADETLDSIEFSRKAKQHKLNLLSSRIKASEDTKFRLLSVRDTLYADPVDCVINAVVDSAWLSNDEKFISNGLNSFMPLDYNICYKNYCMLYAFLPDKKHIFRLPTVVERELASTAYSTSNLSMFHDIISMFCDVSLFPYSRLLEAPFVPKGCWILDYLINPNVEYD